MCLMVCTDRYSSEFSEKLNFFWVLIRTMRKPWNPYHPWRSTETVLVLLCAPVGFYLHLDTWWKSRSNPPLGRISTTWVGGRCYLCVPLLPALLGTTLVFQVGDCTWDRVPGCYICLLQAVLTTLAGLLEVVQELFYVHCIPPECFLKNQSRGRDGIVFITLKVFHTVWIFSYR